MTRFHMQEANLSDNCCISAVLGTNWHQIAIIHSGSSPQTPRVRMGPRLDHRLQLCFGTCQKQLAVLQEQDT